jgi:hypothetical protein
MTYCKQLVGAARDGIVSAHGETHGVMFVPPLRKIAWIWTVSGAIAGIVGMQLARRKPASRLAIGSVAGSFAGLAAATVWASSDFAKLAGRCSARRISAVRDAHWLESNPIDYA